MDDLGDQSKPVPCAAPNKARHLEAESDSDSVPRMAGRLYLFPTERAKERAAGNSRRPIPNPNAPLLVGAQVRRDGRKTASTKTRPRQPTKGNP